MACKYHQVYTFTMLERLARDVAERLAIAVSSPVVLNKLMGVGMMYDARSRKHALSTC